VCPPSPHTPHQLASIEVCTHAEYAPSLSIGRGGVGSSAPGACTGACWTRCSPQPRPHPHVRYSCPPPPTPAWLPALHPPPHASSSVFVATPSSAETQTSHWHAGYIARMPRHDRAGAVVLPVASRSALLHRPARETHAPCATPGLAEAVVVSGRRCTHAAVRGPSRSTRASTRRHNIASGTLHASPVPAAAALRLKHRCAHTTHAWYEKGRERRAGFGDGYSCRSCLTSHQQTRVRW
jgi:hypothetical protein